MTYLIAGASSDIGRALIKTIIANDNEAVIYAHYNKGIEKLEMLIDEIKVQHADDTKLAARIIPVQADFVIPSHTNTSSGARILLDNIREVSKSRGLEGISDISHFIFLPSHPFEYMRIKELDINKIKREMQISVYSFLEIAKELIPTMKKKDNSHILAMLTKYVTDDLPPKFMTDYIVSKYALMGAIKSLQAECGNKITIDYLAPDMIETAFLNNIDPKIIEINREANGGLLKPEDVALMLFEKIATGI